MNFKQLGLSDPILKALAEQEYTAPTPIQQGAIPPALTGRDVLGCAQTGTGKTCAFSTPILQRLSKKIPNPRVIRALILTPTRELAIQIQDSLVAYGKHLPLRSAVIFGGVGQQPQVEKIKKGLDILVATPGRLLDLHGQGLLDLSHIEIFVLDEADRMLDMGFIHDVRRVLKLLPQQKQTLFFSATMPPEVMELVNGLLHNYASVAVDPVSSPVEVINQKLFFVDKNNKTKLLCHLMEKWDIPAALVFSRTKHGANRIARDLNAQGITAAAIHGNKSQTARVQALNDFKAGRVRVLVATDIAARGIDIDELAWVFNYNLPDVPETYVHRIGRTGRAGHSGTAVSFCQFDEKSDLKAIEKLLGRSIPVVEDHPFPMVNLEAPKRDKNGRIVNAEDAEARQAARERRRQRQQEAQKTEQPKAQKPEKPAKGEKKPKGEKPAKKEKLKAPEATPAQPVQEPPHHKRGVRQGKLAETMPEHPSMPETDFYKPNPLDSDIIMDATARLLAPRRPANPPRGERKPRKEQPRQEKPPKAEKPIQGEKAAKQPPKAQEGKRHKGKGEKAKGEHGSVLPPSLSGKRRRSRGNDRPRPVEAPLKSNRQKDSTEYRSLMRPYYLHDED
ncbi:DEAD/DEAH box helicase [Pseudoflavonifractor capillosus]|uniref:DEAD/DEAH box helicase n=1 Tax=Pseudoflavonifractor capillosus TaxID=106588 RepID=UPI00195B4342|nr:DEAD/DEAH box helicase [Pseudoflavonifractor capillosus]MBM6897179.1 DEAD/DEAH box helicase [Pseudoflavonifractor capillosus]